MVIPFPVRLVKGPLHNKVTSATDRQLILQTAQVRPVEFKDYSDPLATTPIDIRTLRYQMLLVTHPLKPNEFIPCVNQKGETLFQYIKE